jgi:hypothetical protein
MPNNSILKRNTQGYTVQDPNAISLLQYNNPSGARKSVQMGQHLLPLPVPGVGTGYTTNVSSGPYALPGMGKSLAIYNSSGTAGSITFGSDNTVTALAAGATDSSGRVGLPCPANAWIQFSAGYSNWVISSSSSLLVFLINDETSIQPVAPTLVSTPVTNPI